ncbi:alpha/beta hydrolase [uncultured Amnibacterium sp.]|uniref:alpha/beta hydrolase n=1 Tax=uncultured Amnibacterium sp. TaxID=1631851 RepID=UPI0035CA40C9
MGSRANLSSLREDQSSAFAETAGRVRFQDRRIPSSEIGLDITVRVYEPVDRDRTVAGVAFFHGGAFVIGDLESEHARCLRYSADAGCVVLSVDYRLAPEHPFPAGLEDCYAALEWMARNSDDLGVDPARVAVAGSSAGGALAASIALLARDRGGPRIALQLLICPVIDDRMGTDSMTRFSDTPVWDNINNAAMWHQYGAGSVPNSKYAAPGREEDFAGLPTACIVTAGHDPLRDEAIEYAQALMRGGVPVELHQVAGAYHGFDQLVPDAEISRRALDEQVYWLRQFLRP